MTSEPEQGLRILIINIHGLLRGNGLEIGRDADNGGQTRYVYEVAEELSHNPEVSHVDIFTRRIIDDSLSEDYSLAMEMINEKLTIHRISFGGKKYRMKEQLWDHLDEFVEFPEALSVSFRVVEVDGWESADEVVAGPDHAVVEAGDRRQ